MNAAFRSGLAILALAVLFDAGVVAAQPKNGALTEEAGNVLTGDVAPAKPTAPSGPEDEFDRGVPRTSIEGFLSAARENDWERAAEYLDLRRLPPSQWAEEGPELARQFARLIDRFIWIHPETLSDAPKGYADDGLPSYQDYIGRIETTDKDVDVLLQRVPRGDGVFIWKFATATVAEIPELQAKYGSRPIGDELARLVPPGRFLGMPLWEWVALLLIVPMVLAASWIIVAIVRVVLRLTRRPNLVLAAARFRGPARLLIFCGLIRYAIEPIGPTVGVRFLVEAQTLLLLAVAWFAVRLVDVVLEHAADQLRDRRPGVVHLLGRSTRNFIRALIFLVAVIVWLDHLGVRVTTLVAGLGIGGLAVALAAQRPIEDLIGAITIYSTQSVRVGDFCRCGESAGTVEEIGLRSTRIRTLDDSVLTIPNGDFAKAHVENLGRRRKIRYHPKVRLRYDTSPEQLRCILVEIRRMLYAHPRVDPDPARVRFVGFGESSLDVEVFAYVDTTDFSEYLAVAEDLNLRIMDVVHDAGSRFALPSQTTYVEPGSGPDEDRANAAEARVQAWRDGRELYLPSFPSHVIDELRGTVPYPPEGSPPPDEDAES